jgi:hypothetical protein
VYSEKKTPDDGQRNCPKHVVSCQNKFVKLVHLFGFIIKKILVCVCVCSGLCLYHSLIQRQFFSCIQPKAAAVATQAASLSPHHYRSTYFLLRTQQKVKVKVKFTLEQSTKAQWGSKDTALLFLQPRRYMGLVFNATVRPL